MVNDNGQLYTIEGIAASVLILTSAYLMLSATTVFTPGETHIYDMQLEQLGNDVLAVMDTAKTWSNPYPKSDLEIFIENNDYVGFGDRFLYLANSTANGLNDDLKYNATIFVRDQTNDDIIPIHFGGSKPYRENAVVVTRWVNIDNTADFLIKADDRTQSVLLEVILWRG